MNYYKFCSQKRFVLKKQIFDHLNKCDKLFIPNLSVRVNIAEYSSKIFTNAELFAYLYNKQVVALVACYLNDHDNKTGYISNVSVVSEHQNKGLAKKLLLKCIEYAKRNNFKKLILEVNKDNKVAKKMYFDLGFMMIEGEQEKMIYRL